MSDIRLRGRPITVVGPSRSDPRLKLFAIIVALQVLGQTVLGFKVSIAQILVTLGFCICVELAVRLWRESLIAWPASALQTGNSVAFILRASGTQHGDWWSLHGIQYFLLASAIGLLSKYLIRPGGRHVFNPSNIGIVWTLIVVGPTLVSPQPLWWGPIGWPVIAALVVIALGAVWLLRPLKMVPMTLSFLVPFTAIVGVFALLGRSFIASWHTGPVAGTAYWLDICSSPEILIFVFFMMSDPRTAPSSPRGRLIYGPAVALLSSALLVAQPAEFGVKLGLLAGLTIVTALVPAVDWLAGKRRLPAPTLRLPKLRLPTVRLLASASMVLVTLGVAVATPAATAKLVSDPKVLLVEQGVISPQ